SMLTPSLSTATDYTGGIAHAIPIHRSVQAAGALVSQCFCDSAFPPIAFPIGKVLLHPLPHSAFPTDVSAGLLAFDPFVLLNLLRLGPNKFRQRMCFSSSLGHFYAPPSGVKTPVRIQQLGRITTPGR